MATSAAEKRNCATASRRLSKKKVLIRFRHGLGDAVQLTMVLRHLASRHPDWQIDVASLVGKHSAFFALCHRSWVLGRDRLQDSYAQVYDLHWDECATCYDDSPSTKADRCLREVFQITPQSELGTYAIQVTDEAAAKANRYLGRVCRTEPRADGRYPVILVHYQGNTSGELKNLPHATVRQLCQEILQHGFVPVILDWDRRSTLPDGVRIHNPHADLELWNGYGTGDAEALAALIEQATLMVGIDSGPLHVAGATTTPTLGVWTGHHPLHYFAPADNVVHLVPNNHAELLRGDRDAGLRYFGRHYRFEEYRDVDHHLQAAVAARLNDAEEALIFTRKFWIRPDNAEQDLVVVKDIAEDDSYRIADLPMPRPVIVDVGAHIGCFSKRVHDRNPLAEIIAVECCPENLQALRRNVAHFARIVPAAMTYEQDVRLLNAVFPDCVTTGGSRVVSKELFAKLAQRKELAPDSECAAGKQYWADERPVPTVTLEELLEQHELDHIDVLKLDCEGSEFSILENTTLLDRIGLIVGEYHDRERFWKLMCHRFESGWKLEILKDGPMGTFWLQRCENAEPARSPVVRCRPGTAARQGYPWIYLCTPHHTGTHFVRLLLELHPQISFWKCGTMCVEGRRLQEWQERHARGEITFRELLRLGIRCESGSAGWSRAEAERLGIHVPAKRVQWDLVQSHAKRTVYWYPQLPTVVTVRDPLLAIISGLRRSDNPKAADDIFAGIQQLSFRDDCFYFCVDRWQNDHGHALTLFDYLGLPVTDEIHQYLSRWAPQNELERHDHLIRNAEQDLVDARRWALRECRVHPCVEKWARRLRDAGLQSFYENLGYQELAWFE